MQHAHAIQYTLVATLSIIILALMIDQYLFAYLPTMGPMSTLKKLNAADHFIKNTIIYFVRYYAFWIVLWLAYHYFTCKDFICSVKSLDKIKNQNVTQLKEQQDHHSGAIFYQPLSNTEQHSSKNQLMQNPKLLTNPKQQKLINQKNSTQSFQPFICPYTITFFIIFTIFFVTISLVQFQISIISNESKNGSQSSKWMGSREYYTLDFFHNIPKQFQDNHQLMDLFDVQDKSVSTVNNWIANYRLFFGLFYLMLKSLSPIILFILFILMFFSDKIKLNEPKSPHKPSFTIGYKLKSIIKHSSQLSLFNLTFLLFMGFSIFSAIFLQLSNIGSSILIIETNNNPQLCSTTSQLKGGFYLSLNKSVQTQIISEVIKTYHSLSVNKDNSHELSRHQILFVFQNMCQIFSPFYTKVTNLQEIFLFSMRLGELFFGFTLMLIVYVKFKHHYQQHHYPII